MVPARKLFFPFQQCPRRDVIPSWESDVTIVIAAITKPDDVIVCVADRMISFGDSVPAHDNASLKAYRLSNQWELAWSANNVNLVQPIVDIARKQINDAHQWDGPDAARIVAEAYSEVLHKEFVATYLSRFGYKTMEQFRTEGRSDLGDQFTELCIELTARFALGVSFILFGHDKQKQPKIYEIDDPGRVGDRNMLQRAVIGSGHDMAMAALLWPPPMTSSLEDSVYRLLEAKFFAETATGVGKTTTAFLKNKDGRVMLLPGDEIKKIRAIWKTEVADVPAPQNAVNLLEKSPVLREVSGRG